MRPLLLAVLLLASGLAQAAQQGAQRVVALAPSLSEIMVELGAGERLVGVLDAGPRLPALAHLPSLGRHGQLNLEALLACSRTSSCSGRTASARPCTRSSARWASR